MAMPPRPERAAAPLSTTTSVVVSWGGAPVVALGVTGGWTTTVVWTSGVETTGATVVVPSSTAEVSSATTVVSATVEVSAATVVAPVVAVVAGAAVVSSPEPPLSSLGFSQRASVAGRTSSKSQVSIWGCGTSKSLARLL